MVEGHKSIAGPFWGESSDDQWIPLTKGHKTPKFRISDKL